MNQETQPTTETDASFWKLSDLDKTNLWLDPNNNALTISRSAHHRESFRVGDSSARDHLVEMLQALEFAPAD